MTRAGMTALVAAVAMCATACQAKESAVPEWLPGFWQMTHDEDGGPLGELVEFRADGSYLWHGLDCAEPRPITFHVHDGEIYVTNLIPNKGPVSVIFHPSPDHRQLSFTSPRTFNNAVYERVALTACKSQR